MATPKITHVAVRFRGEIYSLPPPNRHHHVLWKIAAETGAKSVDALGDDQGFLDESGQYLTREQALVSAQANDQMRADRPVWHDELYSENLW